MPKLNMNLADKPIEELSDDELRDLVAKTKYLRNKMGGAMYWNILNDDYHALRRYCASKGVDVNA